MQAKPRALTPREIAVLRLIAAGHTYAETGLCLGISVHTVAAHIKKLYRKLGVSSAPAAVSRAMQLGMM